MRKLQLILVGILILGRTYGYSQYKGGIGIDYSSSANLAVIMYVENGNYKGGIGIGEISLGKLSENLYVENGNYKGGSGIGEISLGKIGENLFVENGNYKGGIGIGEDSKNANGINLSYCNNSQLVWNGNQNVSWHNSGNWDCGIIPINTSKVTIPTTAIHMPLIINPAIASSVTVLSNASLNLIGATSLLTLTGQ